jgi:hypothetical protein
MTELLFYEGFGDWQSRQFESKMLQVASWKYIDSIAHYQVLIQSDVFDDVLIALAGDWDAGISTLARAYHCCKDQTIQEIERALQLANHPQTSSETLRVLARSDWSLIRQAVAQHPKTPSKVLERLLMDVDNEVRLAVETNPNPPKVRRSILPISSKVEDFGLIIVSDSEIAPGVLDRYSTHIVASVRLAVAKHPKTWKSTLRWLENDNVGEIGRFAFSRLKALGSLN